MPTRIGTITRALLRFCCSTPAPNVEPPKLAAGAAIDAPNAALPAGVATGRIGIGAFAPRLFAFSMPAPNEVVPNADDAGADVLNSSPYCVDAAGDGDG